MTTTQNRLSTTEDPYDNAFKPCTNTRMRYNDNALHHCTKVRGHDHPDNTPREREHTDGERTWDAI